MKRFESSVYVVKLEEIVGSGSAVAVGIGAGVGVGLGIGVGLGVTVGSSVGVGLVLGVAVPVHDIPGMSKLRNIVPIRILLKTLFTSQPSPCLVV